jgi:hypothetical protein
MTSRLRTSEKNYLLAFCHIEKAAGTSLIHILRRIFFLRNAAVRPMRMSADHNFSRLDLRTMFRLNPFLCCIMGHSVIPNGDLANADSPIRFITQVREPVARTLSQYRFWIEKMQKRVSLEKFLSHPTASNFQVKKIAGEENLELAKEILERDFFLAGTVDRFDEFLVLLAGKLNMPLSHFTYSHKNVSPRNKSNCIPDSTITRIQEQNQLDKALHEWIGTQILQRDIAEYGESFCEDKGNFISLQRSPSRNQTKKAIDSVYRNCYLKPMSGAIRLANGLPYFGSYAYRHQSNSQT